MFGRLRVFGVLVLAASLLVPVAAGAGAEELVASETQLSQKPGADGDLRKVSASLLEARSLAEVGAPDGEIAAASATSRFSGPDPLVELQFDKLTAATIAKVEALGFRTLGAYPQYGVMTGYAPFDSLDGLAAIPELAVVSPEYGYATYPGSTISQADVSMNVDDARAALGVDGTGINVGILSDSFNSGLGGTVTGAGCDATITGMVNQGTGDLPAAVKLLNNGSGGTDEGAAMAELIHDLAPGANLWYHTAIPDGQAVFADGIASLAACGADVIVDDVVYFAEPMFQDGIVAQEAAAAAASGVPYFSSAGNNATYGVMETFDDWGATDDTLLPPSGNDFHDFGGGDRFAEITLENGEGVNFALQWDQPFAGDLGPGSAVDLDLYLFPAANPAAIPVDSSVNIQGCDNGTRSGNPFEFISLVNTTGSTQTYHLAVEHYCGSEDVDFRIATYGSGNSITAVSFDPGVFNDLQIYGHAAAEGAVAVGAIYYKEVDSGGTEDGAPGVLDVEAFSSLGGDVSIRFDENGAPLAGGPIVRTRPQIAAVDGTNTTFFGFDSDSDGFPNFFGTSAAAPHAAAVAALMLEVNAGLTPAEIQSIMQSTATDIETPGFDSFSGSGLVDAHAALNAVPTADTTKPTWPGGSALTASNIMETSATVSWNAATDAILDASGSPAAVTGYRVYLDGSLDGTTSSTSYTFDALTSGTTYTAKVEAVDGAGNASTNGPSTTFTTKKTLPPGGTFWDDNGNVHEGNIEAIANAGITRGCNPPVNDQYCPGSGVTRGQMAAFLVRALGLTDDGGGNSFIDDNGSVFEADIAKMAAAGITKGCNPPTNTMFCPNDNVTRGQMAAFLVRALGLTDDGGGNSFIDDDGSIFEADIAKMAAAGITKGCNPPTNNRFCPNDPVKRDQMASFLARALNLAPLVPPSVATFGGGTWNVPADVAPGTYRNSDSSSFCKWARLSGFGGTDADEIEDGITGEIEIVTIAPTDAGFWSEDCGTWSSDLSPRTSSPTANFGGGAFLVGSEVGPGTWRNSDSSASCYWERLSGFGGSLGEIIANEFSDSIQTVTINASDLGFFSERCGTWSKVG